MKSVEIIINMGDLKREVYDFYLENEYYLWLDEYRIETRQSTRHKFRVDSKYSRLDNRHSHISEHAVPLTDYIKELAKDKLREQIQVRKWSER